MVTSTLATERSDVRMPAVIAGILLLIMALAAFAAFGYIHGSLVVEDDAVATFDNLAKSAGLFRVEILGWVVILICDLLVSWALYVFLKPIHRNLSLLGAWLRLTYTALLGIAILNLILVLLLTGDAGYLSALANEQKQALAMLFLEAFDAMWSVGLIVFGGHLGVVGYVALKSRGIPKIFGILLLLAAVGYIAVHAGETFLPQYGNFFAILNYGFMLPMVAGELGFGLWLLLRGGQAPGDAQSLR